MSTADIFKRRLRQAVKESTLTVAEYAQDNHRFKSRTGQLERAVNTRMLNDLSGEVFIDNGIAAYAGFVHNGSAPHRILPNGKKALRWVKNGAFQFARSVNHPGYIKAIRSYTLRRTIKKERYWLLLTVMPNWQKKISRRNW